MNQTFTFKGKHYRQPLPAHVAEGLGLTGEIASGEPQSLEAEMRAAAMAVVERRAAAGDQDAIDGLAEMRAQLEAEQAERDAEQGRDDFADDFADDYPGRAALVKLGLTPADVDALDRDGLIALKGIGETTADEIIALR